MAYPRLGTVRVDFPLREEHPSWLHVSPRRPKQAVVLGYEITAVELDSGRVAWRRARPKGGRKEGLGTAQPEPRETTAV